jgi:hypothetical protein
MQSGNFFAIVHEFLHIAHQFWVYGQCSDLRQLVVSRVFNARTRQEKSLFTGAGEIITA